MVVDAVPTAGIPLQLCMGRVRQRGDSPAGRAGRVGGKVALITGGSAVIYRTDATRAEQVAFEVEGVPHCAYRLDFTIRR
jgi:hypothetical protein